MSLNRIKATQIKDLDLVTEKELSQLNPAYNVFLTKVGSTKVKVVGSLTAPAALTIGEQLRYNTTTTSQLTISGSAGFYDVFAIGDDANSKGFTIDFAATGQAPSGATNYRKIGTVNWDGAAIIGVSSLSDFGLIETQNPTSNGQTIFTLTQISYLPGTNNLAVYVNGSREVIDVNYTETDPTTVTFSGASNLVTTDTVVFVVSNGAGQGGVITTTGSSNASGVTYDNGTSGLSSTNVQTAIDEVVSDINTLTTSNVGEGVNLYFTDERVDDRVSALIQNGTGISWTYDDNANTLTGDVSITQYTDEMAQDAVGSILTDSSTIDFTYNDAGNTITADVIESALTLDNIGGTLSLSKGGTGATDAATALTNLGALAKAGDTMTGALTLSGNPTQDLQATTKAYVDGVAQGLQIKTSVRVATTAALPTNTLADGPDNANPGVGATLTADANGTLPNIDGVTLIVGDRILVKDEPAIASRGDTAGSSANGVFEVTDLGSAGTPWILTRTSDFDDSPDGEVIDGSFVFVGEGTVNADNGFVQTDNNPVTVNAATDGQLVFTQFSGAGQIIAGNGITKSGNTLSVNESQLDLNNISGTLGYDKGGTGFTSFTAGQLLIGKTDGSLAKATLTAGSNISITNGDGTITIASTASGFKTLIASTTDATPTDMLQGDTTKLVLSNNTSWAYDLTLVARTSSGDTASWMFQGAIKRGADASATSLVGTFVKTVLAKDTNAANWDVTITADTTNGALNIQVTGVASTTISWSATVRTSEVTL